MRNQIELHNRKLYNNLYYNKFERYSFEVLSKTFIFKKFTKDVYFNNKKVLEIGFGSGNLIPTLLKKGVVYYGLEISKSAIEIAKKNYGKKVLVRLINKDAIASKNSFFDVIILSHSLEHIYNEDSIMRECKRVLKKGGLVIIGVPSLSCEDNDLHHRLYTKKDLIQRSIKYNFKLMKIKYFKKIRMLDFKNKNLVTSKHIKKHSKISALRFIKIPYYFLVSPILSYLYSLNIGRGKINEYWVAMRK